MGNREDSLQKGLRLYNDGMHREAMNLFESLVRMDTTFIDAKKYAGIAALRLEEYENALHYFSLLASDTQLYANPGKFYQALTLLKRNRPGDKEAARQLLQAVVNEDLERSKEAEDWLKKF